MHKAKIAWAIYKVMFLREYRQSIYYSTQLQSKNPANVAEKPGDDHGQAPRPSRWQSIECSFFFVLGMA